MRMTVIDNSDEVERQRRKALIQKIRAENDAAPRCSKLEMLNFKRRQAERAEQGISEPEYDDFAGIAPADMSELQRQGVLDQARRTAARETKAGDDALVFKTHAPNRQIQITNEPADGNFVAAEASPPPAEFDFYAWLERRLEQERELTWKAVGEAIAEMLHQQRKQAKRDLADEIRQLRIETTELGSVVHLLRAAMAEIGKPVDAPTIFSRRVN